MLIRTGDPEMAREINRSLILSYLRNVNKTHRAEIAKKLHISVKTVETHRRQIMKKLNIFSVAELTKYAVRKGLTSLEG